MAKRILIAGIGNLFLGDDAFGCELARALLARSDLPEEANIIDFGIRSYDLAFALTDGYDAAILLDATPRGEPPGTVSLIEPDLSELDGAGAGDEAFNAHSMNPVRALQMARSLGGQLPGQLYLVGCEPAVLEAEDIGLSEPVRAAIPAAVEMVLSLVHDLLNGNPISEPGLAGRPERR